MATEPRILLLPGMDGTGELFEPLAARLPANAALPIRYPPNHPPSWDALADHVVRQLPEHGRFVLFAESFSGPVALRVLVREHARCAGFVACDTFLSNPAPVLSRLASLPGSWRALPRPPTWAVRNLLLAPTSTPELIDRVHAVVRAVPPRTLVRRLRMLRQLKATTTYAFEFPTVYLHGLHDRLVGPRLAAEFASGVLGCKLVNVPGPHLLAQDRPDEVAPHLLALL